MAEPVCALDDETLMTRPQPASIMSGIIAWVQWKAPRTLTAKMRSQVSSRIWSKGSKASMPALFTRMWIAPRCWCTRATPASTWTRSDTSTAHASARSPISLAAFSAAGPSRSKIATLAPSAASRRATASPIPDAPPVITALRPASPIRASVPRPELDYTQLCDWV
jgi:hypothetical protein